MKIDISKKLKVLLKNNDMTLARLSRTTAIPLQTLHNWVSGQEPRNLAQLKKVANIFSITVDELVYDDVPKIKESSPITKYHDEINAGVFEVILRKVKK